MGVTNLYRSAADCTSGGYIAPMPISTREETSKLNPDKNTSTAYTTTLIAISTSVTAWYAFRWKNVPLDAFIMRLS